MSLPRFLRGFNKTKSSSSSTHLVHNQVASDLNLSDASSSSSSSGPKDALGQPLPVSTVIISSKKPPSIALTAPDLDTNEPPISSTSTSLKDPGSHDAPPSSSDLPIPSSTRSSRSSSRSSSTSSTVPIPIASNKPRSNRNHDDYDEEINGPTHPSLLSTSCPNFTFTSFSEYVPTPPIPTVHITSPRPPRPSYPLPPIPAEELSSSPTSLPLSTTIPRNRVRSNALSVLSDPQPVPGNSSNSLDGSETLSRPVKLHDQAKIESDRQGDHKEVTEDKVPPLAPRFRSLSTSTSVDSTSSRPVSILKKPRSILRSRSGSQPLPEPMARTGSGSESLIPAFPAPPTSRHSGSSDTSFASASGSWYLQHDPSEMARREEARSDVVPVPRVRRSNSHSQRRLSGRDQDVKEQDASQSNSNTSNSSTTTSSINRHRMPPTTSNLASPSGPDDHDPVTKRRGNTNPDTTASTLNRLSFPSLNDFKSSPSSLAPSLPGEGVLTTTTTTTTPITPTATATATATITSSSSSSSTATADDTLPPSSIAQTTAPQSYTPISLKSVRLAKSRSKLRQEPQIGVATGMRRNSLPKSSLMVGTGTETPSDLPPLPSVSPPPPENSNNTLYIPARRNTEGALSATTLDGQLHRRRENSYNSTTGGHPMPPVMLRPILKDTSAKDKALRESWMSEPPGNNGINISHTHGHRPASGTPGSSSSSPSPITPPKSLARANSASAKRQSKLRSTVEHDQDALTPRPRQPPVNGYGPDYRPRRQSGGPGHLLYALDPSTGGVDESEDNEDSDFDDSFSRSKHLQDQYARLQKSQLRQSMLENPILPHGTADNNTPYDKPRQRKSLGDELNVPPVPEKSAQRKRVSTMGSATLPAVSPSLSAALTSVSEAIIVRSDSKKQKDRKPFATVGSNALSFEPLFALKDGSPKQSRESSVLTTYRDSLASRLSGVSDSDWAGNPLLMDIIQPGVSILDLSKKDLTEIPSGLPTSITHLRLAYNSIHNLAPLASLTSLHYLQVLDLCDNQLDTLPSEIGLLSKLKELYLSNNKLWKLPDTIHRMARLEVLDIRGNQFYLLNPMIGRLKTLRQLDVRNNQLKSLPAPLCMLSSTLSVLLVDGNQFVQPFSDLLQPLFTTDSDSGPQSFLGDDPYADSGRKNTGSVSTLKSTGVYEPWRRSVVPSAPKRVPTLIKRRSHGDLMTIIGLQKKEGYSNSTDDLAAELQKANTISGSSGAYIAASLSASDSSPGRRERSVSTSNTGPSEFQSESGSSHPLSLNKFIKSFRKSSRSSLKEPSVSSSKKRLSVGSELDPSEDGQGSESVYGGSQYEQEDSGKGAHPSKRGPTGGINQWVRDRFHKRANSNELGSLPNASSTSINLDTQDSEPHAVRDSGYGGGGTTHSPDFSAPSGLARMNKSTGHLPFGSPVSPRDTQLLSSFDPLFKKERDYRFSYMSMESQMTQGTENDIDALDISAPLAHRLSSMHSPTTPLPSSPVMLATSTAGSISVWNSGAGPRYGQSAAQMKPIMQYLKDLHDLDPDSSEWEEVYAWRRVWNAERSTTLGLTGNDAEREQEQEEGDQQAKAEEIRLAKLQAQATRRRKIMAEIIETERTYVDGLKGLVEIYLTPAQQVMPASDHKAVFSNAQALYTFHASHFLPELEKAYAVTRETKVPIASSSPMSPIPSSSPFLSDPSAPSSASSSTAALGVHHESGGQSLDISVMSTPHDSCIEATNETTDSVTTPQPEECRIGRVFAEHVAYMKMYSFYVNNYDNALRVLQTQLTNSKYKKKTKEFLRRCAKHPNHTQLGLQGYLLLPVQRIPRYKMLLGDLLENTWPDHVDYQDIATALDKISSRADEMNERKRQYENHEKVLLVQNRIVGQYKTPLVQPHRKVVREGMLHLIRTVTRNVSMSEKAVVPSGQTPVGDLTVHHLSEETVEKSFLFILFNDILIQCQPCGPKASGAAAHLTGAGAGSTGGMGGSGVIAGGSSANLGASDSAKNLELCRVLQLESRLHPAEVIGNDVLRVVDDAMVMYLTGDKDVIQAWKEDINSRW